MDQILQTVGDAIGSIFDNPVIQLGFKLVAVYWVILWIAAAYWAFRDMQGRSDNPLAPYLAAAFVIVFTPLLFPLAVFTRRVRAQPRRGGDARRDRGDPALPVLRSAGGPRLDHLSHVPRPAEPRLPELHPARRPRLVAVRLVRP